MDDSLKTIATLAEKEAFYKAFFIKPGTTFDPLITDLAISRIIQEPNVQNAWYELFNAGSGDATINSSLTLNLYVEMKNGGKESSEEKGIFSSKNISDFPLLYQSGNTQFKFLLNGGLGLFNDENAFFGEGPAFTQGNSIATEPAQKGNKFWLEAFVEPGISGITKLGKSKTYLYGEASGLLSARNTTDVYSKGSAAFFDVERLYAGLLITGLGKNKDITINSSYGRNFFQLNDGFLFSRISGSSNAGFRASAYLSSRTAFQKNANLAIQWKKFRLSGNFIEPEELYKDRQVNTNYVVTTLDYNDNKKVNAGLSYINTTGGKAFYVTSDGTLAKKGMFILNPKLWLTDIGHSGAFFKSEFAWQNHVTEDMKSYAWYAGLGCRLKDVRTSPSIYYRYAFMQGDDPDTKTYERFDPLLTGGLGNWVQGLNFRKVAGNGNIISHRMEASAWLTGSMALSLDYFYLQANQRNNLGGLEPIKNLKSKELGHEVTLSLQGLIKNNLTLLAITSYSIPGKGYKDAFAHHIPDWFTAQLALFINY